MTPPHAGYANPLRVPVNLSSEELSALDNNLRFEFGPSVITPERVKELTTILALVDTEFAFYGTQRTKLVSLLSPMRRLPNETLLHIFQDACEENLLQCYPWTLEEDNGGSPGAPIKPPTQMTSPIIAHLPSMAISSVCSRWRNVALSAPTLWVNLAVETHSAYLYETNIFVGFIDTVTRYLKRSGDSPLRLELSISGSPDFKDKVPGLVPLIRRACRWKIFRFSGYHCDSLSEYLVHSDLHFPLLAELIIDEPDELGDFEDCPKLCALSTSRLPKPTSHFYNQLDHLSFFGNPRTDLVEALRSSPSLKSLKFGNIHDGLAKTRSHDNITSHDNLTSLHVLGGFSDMMFSSFNFPSLRKLVVDGQYDWPADAFPSFISRSSCMITTFTLRGVSLSDLDLIAVLRVMPALLHLEVDKLHRSGEHQSPITSHLLSSLTRDPSTSISLVPRLHSLHLTCICESTDVNNDGSDDGSDEGSDEGSNDEFNDGSEDESNDGSDNAPDNESNDGSDNGSDNGSGSEFDDEFDDAAFIRMVQSRWFKPGSDLAAEMSALGKSSIRSVVLKFTQREVDADIYKPLWVLDSEGLRVVVSGTNGVQV